MSQEKPLKLRFFDSGTTEKFKKLCISLDVGFFVLKKDNEPDEVTTALLTPTKRRELISKWANLTMERE